MQISLLDLTGKEILEIHNDLVEGIFSKTVNTEHFAKGVYFLKILVDGKYTIAKIVVN